MRSRQADEYYGNYFIVLRKHTAAFLAALPRAQTTKAHLRPVIIFAELPYITAANRRERFPLKHSIM